jgi:tetratricopeptide (TPR) repeat protein
MHRGVSIVLLVTGFCLSCSSNGDHDKEIRDLFIKGKTAYLNKKFDEAESYFKKILSKDKNNHNARLMLGKTYFYKKEIKAALDEFSSIIDDDPDNIGALFWMAKSLLYVKDGKESDNEKKAKSSLIKLVEIDSSHVAARSLLALLCEKEGNYKEALYHYEQIIEEERQIVDSRTNLGILYKKIGLKQKAVEQINIAIDTARINNYDLGTLKKIKAEIEK